MACARQMLDQIRRADVVRWRGRHIYNYNTMKMIINENPQKYYYGPTNPQGSENPCPLTTSRKHLGKSRGLMAFDLMKTCKKSRFPLDIKQKDIQECCRPQFDHPKILHILIDRAAGYGCKKLSAAHGGSTGTISKFLKSMGFDTIKPHKVIDKANKLTGDEKEDRLIAELMKSAHINDKRSVAKFDERSHWGNHLAYFAWRTLKYYYVRNPNRPTYMTDEEKRESARASERKRRKDPVFRMKENASKRARKYIKTPGLKWDGFGCTSDEYRAHMQKQFTKRMTWANYGTYWHDDHIRPRASFDWNDPEQRRQCEHYTNKQPLEAKKNLAKSDNWDGQIGFDHILG